MKIQNFAQLKNHLQVGMKLKLVDTSMRGHKNLGIIRTIEKKQTNAIKFEGGSWLGLGSTGEKASDFTFQDNGFTLLCDKDTKYEGFLKYQFID